MDISIRITKHELDAIENYVAFCTRWHHGSDPCSQCGKQFLTSDNCYGCDEHKKWIKDKDKLYDSYGDVLNAPGVMVNPYVKVYIDAAIDANKAKEEVTRAQKRLEIEEEHRMRCLAAFTIREDEDAKTEEDRDE